MQDLKEFLAGLAFVLMFFACIVLGIYVIICYLCGYIPPAELLRACLTHFM